jgi:hypothetical protein
MTKVWIPSLAMLISLVSPFPGAAQRIDSRVGTNTAQQPQAPRPYSTPNYSTATRQTAIQARIGANGQIVTDPGASSPTPSTPRTTSEPQLMRDLGPVATRASSPILTPSAPAPQAESAPTATPQNQPSMTAPRSTARRGIKSTPRRR